jgi:signal transduction histidine kinase
MEHINVLLIEQNLTDARMVKETLTGVRDQGGTALTFSVTYADCLAVGLQRLAERSVEVILLDLMLPDSQGLDTLVRVGQQAPKVPVIVLTDVEGESVAKQAVQLGAEEYLIKRQLSAYGLVQTIRYAVERRRMRLALLASEKRFRNLIGYNADGMIVVDPTGVIRFVNRAAEALFGRSAETLVGSVFGFPVMVGETTELDIVDGNGEIVVAEMRVVETEWEGDKAYLASLRDITKRRYAEEVLRRQEEQLRQLQKMEAIGRLAGGIAHDFNNLLTAIIGYSDIILMRLDKDDALYRYIEQISKAANRAALLTRQLLAFSRRQLTQPRVVVLNTVVAEMEKMLRPLIGEDIELSTTLDPQLGHIQADLGHLQQLLMNLVVNARDAMPQGGRLLIETANVDLTDAHTGRYLGAPPGPYVMLAVTDTGEGMDAETLPHLFEPFFTTKEMGKGTGLGLAVVYGILQQNGGDIEVHSEPRRGTTFRIYLPRVMESVHIQRTSDTPGESPSGLETVLLVEDEEIVRVLIRDTLRIKGYCVLEATDTAEALRLCEQYEGPIHLLVTDVVMPGMNGRELAEHLVPLRPHMRVLFISGHSGDAVARHGVFDADAAFLRKPFTPDVLARKVRAVLDSAPSPALLRIEGVGVREGSNSGGGD